MEEKRYLYDRIMKKDKAISKTIWIIVVCAFALTEIILCMYIYEENVKIRQEILTLSAKERIDLEKLKELAINYEIKEQEDGKIIISYDYSTNRARVELTLDEDFRVLRDNLDRDYLLTILVAVYVAALCGAVLSSIQMAVLGISHLCKYLDKKKQEKA